MRGMGWYFYGSPVIPRGYFVVARRTAVRKRAGLTLVFYVLRLAGERISPMRLVLFILALSCAVAIAEEQRPLKAINRDAFPEEKRCSEYFFTTTYGGSAAEQVVFAYETPEGSVKRDTIPRKRVVVQIADSLAWEKTATDDGPGAIFRLTAAEYDKARGCLPEPKAK
jgi:hypothetical protein